MHVLSYPRPATVRCTSAIPRSSAGNPIAFDLQGRPISACEAVELSEDIDRCTVIWTPVTLPSGTAAVVRTLYLVIDERASRGPVPEDYEPQLYASDLYTAEVQPRFVWRLCTYASLSLAAAGHPRAVEEFVTGRTHVDL